MVSREVFVKAAEIVRREHGADDLVVVLPYSQMTPRLLLGDLEVIELRTVDPSRFADYRRVWLFDVAAVGRSERDVAAVESSGTSTVMMDDGGLRLVRIDITAPRDPPLRRPWRR